MGEIIKEKPFHIVKFFRNKNFRHQFLNLQIEICLSSGVGAKACYTLASCSWLLNFNWLEAIKKKYFLQTNTFVAKPTPCLNILQLGTWHRWQAWKPNAKKLCSVMRRKTGGTNTFSSPSECDTPQKHRLPWLTENTQVNRQPASQHT